MAQSQITEVTGSVPSCSCLTTEQQVSSSDSLSCSTGKRQTGLFRVLSSTKFLVNKNTYKIKVVILISIGPQQVGLFTLRIQGETHRPSRRF